MTLREQLRQLLTGSGSVSEISEKTRVPAPQVSRLRNGLRQPSWDTFEKLARGLKWKIVCEDDLSTGLEPEPHDPAERRHQAIVRLERLAREILRNTTVLGQEFSSAPEQLHPSETDTRPAEKTGVEEPVSEQRKQTASKQPGQTAQPRKKTSAKKGFRKKHGRGQNKRKHKRK